MSLWRELKRASELRVVAAALVVAVAAVSTIGFFTDRVQGALNTRATDLLGADMVMANPAGIDTAVKDKVRELGLQSVALVEFPSVALTDDDDSSLIAVKVVSEGYPLRGELQVSERVGGDVSVATGVPAPGEFWVEGRLLSELGLAIGDKIQVGRLNHAITRVIHYESDRGGSLFQVAPRVMFNQADLEASVLIGEGSRVRYALQLNGEEAELDALRHWVKQQDIPGLQVQGVRDARPEIRTALDRVGRFLGLAAMLTVLVAGAAITVALQGLVQRESDTAAIKRCFGASQAEVLGQLFRRLGWVSLGASALGLVIGFVMQAVIAAAIGQWFDADLPAPGPLPAIAGVAIGLITLIGFGLPSVLRIRQVPVVRVLRRELGAPPAAAWMVGGAALFALALLLLWQAKSATLAGLVLLSMVVTVLLLALAARAVVWLTRRWRGKLRPGVSFGISALSRRQGTGILQVSSFGLGLLALLLLSVVGGDLLENWQRELPDDAPNMFLINIQPEQRDGIEQKLQAASTETVDLYPMSRGRLVEINGEVVDPKSFASPREQRLAQREWNISSLAQARDDNPIVAGEWWDETQLGQALFSVEVGIAESMGISIGDTLTYRVAGEDYSGVVTNFREVTWDSFKPNFFLVATPGWQSVMPATYMTSLRLPAEGQGALIASLVREFPGITALDVRAMINQIRGLLDSGSAAVRYTLAFTLLAGVVVLIAAVQASATERRREAALQRAMGATGAEVRAALLAEFASLGAIAGLLAAVVAVVVGQLVSKFIFEVQLPIDWALLLVAPMLAAVGVALAGWFAARSVLQTPPVRVLSSEV